MKPAPHNDVDGKNSHKTPEEKNYLANLKIARTETLLQ
jgi:hypothetical protein